MTSAISFTLGAIAVVIAVTGANIAHKIVDFTHELRLIRITLQEMRKDRDNR